ncbi:MAG TPA: DUF5690 family protein [Sediminibacterium sp.]|nr:DUF5690 family protein [Sediminibacterium sp.]
MERSRIIQHHLAIGRKLNSSSMLFVVYASFASFVAYSCMYGFRKPFTVGLYADLYVMGISYKVCLVIAQVLGYMISKFLGIRFISGMNPVKRIYYILLFIGIAWISLLLFALIPAPYNIVCLFINGLPLGMIFGLIFGLLEGRKTTEIMGAFLATSFIFASGLAKTIGKWLLIKLQISEWWMPFAAGAFFLVPLLVSVWLLGHMPPPSVGDVARRNIRKPMTGKERSDFLKQFGLAISPVVISYATFTIVRDFCEDFSNELWLETGHTNIGIFAQTSTIMSLVVLLIIASFFLIRNNYVAFIRTHYLIIAGLLLSFLATLLFNMQVIDAFAWMLSATTGLYLAYLPFNCLYFERFLSVYELKANVGFVMYIADAFGYLGTVLVLLIKEFVTIEYSWTSFFSNLFYSSSIVGVVLIFCTVQIHHKLFKSYNGYINPQPYL